MSTPLLDGADYAQFRGLLEKELRRCFAARLANSDALDLGAMDLIDQVFVRVFPAAPAPDRLRFSVFAAPLMRKMIIEAGSAPSSGVRPQDLERWLERLERLDPCCARLIDLHYFVGLTLQETAAAFQLPLPIVVRKLRFAKAWLNSRLHATQQSDADCRRPTLLLARNHE